MFDSIPLKSFTKNLLNLPDNGLLSKEQRKFFIKQVVELDGYYEDDGGTGKHVRFFKDGNRAKLVGRISKDGTAHSDPAALVDMETGYVSIKINKFTVSYVDFLILKISAMQEK
ncbi:MAG: hypothetical protein R3B60_04280 [Candidatus Paceibacterota bacterium]